MVTTEKESHMSNGPTDRVSLRTCFSTGLQKTRRVLATITYIVLAIALWPIHRAISGPFEKLRIGISGLVSNSAKPRGGLFGSE